MVPFKCLQNLAFAQTARKNLINARLLLLAKFCRVTRVTWRKTFPFIKKNIRQAQDLHTFRCSLSAFFLKCSDCSQDKIDHRSCAQKWIHCLHTFKSSERPLANHILRPFTLKVNLTIRLLKSHYSTCHPWSQIYLATGYHREIQSTSSYHLKETQNIRSQKNCSLNSLHTAYTM